MPEKNGILIIGGTGFLGTALARHFQQSRRHVYILARHRAEAGHERATVVHASQDDEKVLDELLPRCGTVFHLASTTTPGISARHPALEGEQNLTPMLRFLEMLQQYPEVGLVYVSSGGAIYGDPDYLPVDERHPLRPLSYHGAGKAAIEAFLNVYRLNYGSRVTILRPSNVYGPGQSLRQGFGLIRTMLQHALTGEAMEIWGDGEVVRDFVYIDDVVRACEGFVDEEEGGTFNVGSGEGHSLNQVRAAVEAVCGRPLPVHFRTARRSDVKQVVLDSGRLMSRGWQPTVGLHEGIRRTWEWLSRQ